MKRANEEYFEEFKSLSMIGKIVFLVGDAISFAEGLSPATGEEKKDEAFVYVMSWCDHLGIDIPMVPRFIEKKIVERIVDRAIDGMVSWMNARDAWPKEEELILEEIPTE